MIRSIETLNNAWRLKTSELNSCKASFRMIVEERCHQILSRWMALKTILLGTSLVITKENTNHIQTTVDKLKLICHSNSWPLMKKYLNCNNFWNQRASKPMNLRSNLIKTTKAVRWVWIDKMWMPVISSRCKRFCGCLIRRLMMWIGWHRRQSLASRSCASFNLSTKWQVNLIRNSRVKAIRWITADKIDLAPANQAKQVSKELTWLTMSASSLFINNHKCNNSFRSHNIKWSLAEANHKRRLCTNSNSKCSSSRVDQPLQVPKATGTQMLQTAWMQAIIKATAINSKEEVWTWAWTNLNNQLTKTTA